MRLWLERYTERGDAALDVFDVAQEAGTYEIASLVFDVLNSGARERGGEDKPGSQTFPDEARDYIEEYLYRLCEDTGQHAWNHPEAATAILPTLLDMARNGSGDASDEIAITTAIERLTTRKERREFLTKSGARYEASSTEARDREAAFKLARVLADPATPEATRQALGVAVLNFTSEADVMTDHPALVKRAFVLACEARPKGRVRAVRRERRRLLALLDSIEEKGGGR